MLMRLSGHLECLRGWHVRSGHTLGEGERGNVLGRVIFGRKRCRCSRDKGCGDWSRSGAEEVPGDAC
jgi:hypothetical protein